ncbi:phage scaffolding protein [Blautia sp.]|uniref:phage scaffolding protein n=1 Tax=Blautia sp. TaxID=1955243 RepID=UPI002A8190BB|nr:phage scaffolding protein [Blautia sp.]MDY4404736.1 phage scaffolding protein [Blautia sp.]
MEFLKEILGDGYAAFEKAVKDWNAKPENKDKQVKIANVGNGDYVSKSKYDAADMAKKNLETQLKDANERLEKFKDVDAEKLQAEVTKLSNDMKIQKTNYENQIADMQFSSILESAISEAGARNAKAVKALLDVDALKKSKDQTADIKAAIEACQKENDYLFGAREPINNPTGPTNGPIIGITKEQFSKMGYKERLELKQKDPNKYNELKGEQ